MLTITPNYTLLKYDNVTVSIPYDTIITHNDLNKVSIRVHSIYKSLRTLVEKYKMLIGKVTVGYGYLYLEDDSFDDVHKDALESELIKCSEDGLIKKAFDKLHKQYKEFRTYLGSEFYCQQTLGNYFATKEFYENCARRNKAIVNANEQGVATYYDDYEFDCSLPKFD